MTFLKQEKDICNQKYKEAITLFDSGDYRKAKVLIIEVMEKLLNIYNVYAISNLEKLFYEEKIRKLLDLCKQINELAKQEGQTDNSILTINETELNLHEEFTLGPKNKVCEMKLCDFCGQEKLKTILSDSIAVAKIRKMAVDHILFYGSAGLGKTTLSRIVASEMDANIIELNAPTIKDLKTIINVFKCLKKNDIIFIDEIHRLPKVVCEAIYTAMQDNKLIYIDNEKNIEIDIPDFTLIGATTHSGLLQKPFRDRFYIQLKLELYKDDEISSIISKIFAKQNLTISNKCLNLIAKRSRGVPRIAIGFANRIIDKAIIKNIVDISEQDVEEYFKLSEIDDIGLNGLDIRYLQSLDNFGGGPIGLDTISSALNENKNIIQEQCEPYLIYLGFVGISSKGRFLTEKGIEYLKKRGFK